MGGAGMVASAFGTTTGDAAWGTGAGAVATAKPITHNAATMGAATIHNTGFVLATRSAR
jgi:hypothetical protein